MDKLKRLEDIISVIDKDTVSQEEFVANFGVLMDLVAQIQEANDKHIEQIDTIVAKRCLEALNQATEKLKLINLDEWKKVQQRISLIKNGVDGKDGESIVGPKGDKGESIVGPKGDKGDSGVDLFPDTPEQLTEKINLSKEKINPEQIRGLKEIETMAKMNAMPVTTTHFYRDGVSFGRAKNVNMIGSMVSVTGDQASITPVVVSTTAPTNPFLNQLWVDIS